MAQANRGRKEEVEEGEAKKKDEKNWKRWRVKYRWCIQNKTKG